MSENIGLVLHRRKRDGAKYYLGKYKCHTLTMVLCREDGTYSVDDHIFQGLRQVAAYLESTTAEQGDSHVDQER